MAESTDQPAGAVDALEANPRQALVIVVVVLLALTVGMFRDVLFGGGRVLSKWETDLSQQFVPWRAFGFGELRAGNLALWNPHIYGGCPFLGGSQSALLYPPNALFLVLPLGRAINVSIALHVFLMGLFTYLWVRRGALHPAAGLLAAVVMMFCGAHFMHVYRGHLTSLCAMVWAPLVFLSIDGLAAKPRARACLLGVFAVAMQILSGHPQYVFYTGVAAVIYAGACAVRAERRLGFAAGFVAVYAGGAALAAAQLLPAVQAAGESVRSGGVSYAFAASFSFPPENFATLLAPDFFGDLATVPYWGRCYLWEMSLFAGVTALVLAVYGAVRADKARRRPATVMVGVLLVLALAGRTPLFHLLYRWVPGFDRFRSNSKFIFHASLFIALLAALGLHALLKQRGTPGKAVVAVLIAAALVAAAGLLISIAAPDPESWWAEAVQTTAQSEESYLPPHMLAIRGFAGHAGALAARGLFTAAGTLLAAAAAMYCLRFSRLFGCALALLGTVELFAFAQSYRPTFRLERVRRAGAADLLSAHPGDDRVLNLHSHNNGMLTGRYDVWGYDPGVLRRYAEFLTFTQGGDPDHAGEYLRFLLRAPGGGAPKLRLHRLYAMLRLRYVLAPDKDGLRAVARPDPMPRLHLAYDYRVIPRRDDLFAALGRPTFDPRETVILETDPGIGSPAREGRGTVRLLDASTDHLTIEANLAGPAVLLVTDAYSAGWRARALPGSAQDRYDVLPANYCLRAVPLRAGRHRFRMEYRPTVFVVGVWVSVVSAVLYAGAAGWLLLGHARRASRGPDAAAAAALKRSRKDV